LVLGLSFLFKENDKNKISIYHKILIVIFGYFILPLIISIPFYTSIYNITFLDAYFESISGFTSTGFTIFNNIKHLDESLILWRSSSQWVGGLYFLFSLILLIDIFDENIKKSLTNFLSFNISETFKQSFKILILYFILTVLIFLILKLFDFRTFDSFNLSMSLVSSGGFLPSNSLSTMVNTNAKEIIFSFLMLVSFFSIFLSYNLIFFTKKNINFFQEDFYLFIYFVCLSLLFFLFFNYNYDFSSVFLSLISSISNFGFSLDNTSEELSFLFLILVIIGGSFFSTSSGIRFLKLFSLFKFSINNLISHVKPKNIFLNKHYFFKISFKDADANKYFLSVMFFIISLSFLSIFLTFSGISFENSFKVSILTLMNTTNSSMYGLYGFNFEELEFITKFYLIIFMIIGRVELLTIFIIFKKYLFKN